MFYSTVSNLLCITLNALMIFASPLAIINTSQSPNLTSPLIRRGPPADQRCGANLAHQWIQRQCSGQLGLRIWHDTCARPPNNHLQDVQGQCPIDFVCFNYVDEQQDNNARCQRVGGNPRQNGGAMQADAVLINPVRGLTNGYHTIPIHINSRVNHASIGASLEGIY
jgi:hypothetical protein